MKTFCLVLLLLVVVVESRRRGRKSCRKNGKRYAIGASYEDLETCTEYTCGENGFSDSVLAGCKSTCTYEDEELRIGSKIHRTKAVNQCESCICFPGGSFNCADATSYDDITSGTQESRRVECKLGSQNCYVGDDLRGYTEYRASFIKTHEIEAEADRAGQVCTQQCYCMMGEFVCHSAKDCVNGHEE